MFFASDNSGPVHPEILSAIVRANDGYARAYGADRKMQQALETLKEVFEAPQAAVYLVSTGSAANALALATLSQPWQTVFCSPQAHIHQDECNAPEFFGGNKLTIVPGGDKIEAAALRSTISQEESRGVHGPQRGPISITQITERGNVYSLKELHEITRVATDFGLLVHMDGARLANAVVRLGCSPAEATWKAGIDAVSFGGTKNGCLQLEAVVLFEPEFAWEFELRRKRGAHLISKHRYLLAQLSTYLKDNLWLESARQANRNATRLAKALQERQIELVSEPEANMIFFRASRKLHQRLFEKGAVYHLWDGTIEGPKNELITARLVCDWSLSSSQLDAFAALF